MTMFKLILLLTLHVQLIYYVKQLKTIKTVMQMCFFEAGL